MRWIWSHVDSYQFPATFVYENRLWMMISVSRPGVREKKIGNGGENRRFIIHIKY